MFQNWFENHFISQIQEHVGSKGLTKKAIFLIGNAIHHQAEEILKSYDGQIVQFLTSNVTY